VAIYTLQHRPIGRTKRVPGTNRLEKCRPGLAAAYARYIFRSSACSTIIARLPDGVPATVQGVSRWLAACERTDRANARICDRIMVAIPCELPPCLRTELIQTFAERLSQGRLPYAAAIHDLAGDDDNPHCHMILRDRDLETGRRVLRTSDAGSTEYIREVWETVANEALANAGYYERIDRRTLFEQGLDRRPGFHRGPDRRAVA